LLLSSARYAIEHNINSADAIHEGGAAFV